MFLSGISPNESREATKGLQDVGIAGPRLADGGSQLGVAQGPENREDPADGPHHQRQAEGACVEEHPFGGDEDA